MRRAALVSLLLTSTLAGGCAPRTAATVAMVVGSATVMTGSIMVADVYAHPRECNTDDAMGFGVFAAAAGCGAAEAVRGLPGAMLMSLGVSTLLTGIIAYVRAPADARQERPDSLRNLRGERWTRLRDARERGRSGR